MRFDRLIGQQPCYVKGNGMVKLIRFNALIVTASIALALFVVAAPSARAQAQMQGSCASNANLAHVHRRLLGAMEQLNHDQRDYGGHRDAALTDLQNARDQLIAAEQYAVKNDGARPGCFQAIGATGGSNAAWGQRQQGGSNYNIRNVTNNVGRLIEQLNGDQHDYGGYRVKAIGFMQQAQAQLQQAEQYAQTHGY